MFFASFPQECLCHKFTSISMCISVYLANSVQCCLIVQCCFVLFRKVPCKYNAPMNAETFSRTEG